MAWNKSITHSQSIDYESSRAVLRVDAVAITYHARTLFVVQKEGGNLYSSFVFAPPTDSQFDYSLIFALGTQSRHCLSVFTTLLTFLCGKKSSPYGTRTRVSSDRFSMKARYTNPCTNKDFEMVASGIAIPIALATLVPTRCQLSSAQLGRPQVQSLRAYRYSSNFEATPERVGSWSVIFIDMFTRCPFRPVVVSLAFWACSNHTYVRIESLQRARGPAVPKRNDSKLAIVRLTSIKESSHTKIHRSLII